MSRPGVGTEYDSSFEDDTQSCHSLSTPPVVKSRRLDLAGSDQKLSSRHNIHINNYGETINSFARLSAYEKHQKLIHDYILPRSDARQLLTRDGSKDNRDIDLIKQHFQFIWDDDSESSTNADAGSLGYKIAKKYCQRLYKEYCICDLSRYKENKIALRWRTQHEVVKGTGQFVCANKKCDINANLRSWEVVFTYVEQGKKKTALVKVRLCSECSRKLNYHSKKKDVTKSAPVADYREPTPDKERAFPAFGPESATPDKHAASKPDDTVDQMAVWRTTPHDDEAEEDQMSKFIDELLL